MQFVFGFIRKMAKEQKITPVRQHNVNEIRRIRLELDITGEVLSIELGKKSNYITNIEGASHDSCHTDHGMNKIAIYFTKIAKERQAELNAIPGNTIKLKTDYTIYDFYPKKPLSEILQIKTSTPIPRNGGPTATLNALIEIGFFDTQKTLKEVVVECNRLQNQSWISSDFTAILLRAKNSGRLLFKTQPDDTVRYQKA